MSFITGLQPTQPFLSFQTPAVGPECKGGVAAIAKLFIKTGGMGILYDFSYLGEQGAALQC